MTFAVGEKVEVIDQTGTVLSTRVVVMADESKAVTKCGRHWRQSDGFWLGENGAYPFPHIRAATGPKQAPRAADQT